MFNKGIFSSILAVVVMVIIVVFSQNVFAVDIGDGIETGMFLSEVEDKFELEHFKTTRGLTSYQRIDTGTFYFFNKETEILIYKLVVMADKKWDKIESLLEKKCGDPVVEKDSKGNNVYFFKDSDTGFKMVKNDMFDDAWQLWYGSVSLWNEVAKENGMNEFPE